MATPDLMKSVLDREAGIRTDKVIGQVVLMEISRDARRFLMTDTGVTVSPTLDQKRDLLGNLVLISQALKCPRPRVAVMSATQKPVRALPDTEEAVELVELGAAGAFGKRFCSSYSSLKSCKSAKRFFVV